MNGRWYEWDSPLWAAGNTVFFTVMAVWLFADNRIGWGGVLAGCLFLIVAIWYWLLWGAVLGMYYHHEEQARLKRLRIARARLLKHPHPFTACHNSGAFIPREDE